MDKIRIFNFLSEFYETSDKPELVTVEALMKKYAIIPQVIKILSITGFISDTSPCKWIGLQPTEQTAYQIVNDLHVYTRINASKKFLKRCLADKNPFSFPFVMIWMLFGYNTINEAKSALLTICEKNSDFIQKTDDSFFLSAKGMGRLVILCNKPMGRYLYDVFCEIAEQAKDTIIDEYKSIVKEFNKIEKPDNHHFLN